jgi:hypothetical protein
MAGVEGGIRKDERMPDSPNASASRGSGDLAEGRLPPAGTTRWVAHRKAQVVEAIQSGRLSLDEAWRRYRLGVEEFGAWKRALYRFGEEGLRVARTRAGRAGRRRPRQARPAGASGHG